MPPTSRPVATVDRCLAYAIDSVAVWAAVAPAVVWLRLAAEATTAQLPRLLLSAAAVVTLSAPAWYRAYATGRTGRTLGRTLVGYRVTGADRTRHGVAREALLLGLGIATVGGRWLTDDGRLLHDALTSTSVQPWGPQASATRRDTGTVPTPDHEGP